MRALLLFLLLVLPLAANEVTPQWAVLLAQREAWNRGDLDAFLEGYVQSDDLVFTSGGQITRGYGEIKQRYQKKYGTDKSTMGKLDFEAYKTEYLGDSHALVIGKWHLEWPGTKKKPLQGVFSLVMVKTDKGWKILHDHTSATP